MATSERPLPFPFSPGEELTYQSSLLGINAGAARLRFMLGGEPGSVAIELVAATSDLTSLFFAFEESARIECDAESLRPRTARIRASIAGDRQDLSLAFDDATGTLLVRHTDEDDSTVDIFHAREPWDPVSLVMRMRSQDLSPPYLCGFDVLLGKQLCHVDLETIAVEDVTTPAGTFAGTHHVRGTVYEMQDDGSPGAQDGDTFDFWFATNGTRPVVKMTRPTPLGRVVFVLAE